MFTWMCGHFFLGRWNIKLETRDVPNFFECSILAKLTVRQEAAEVVTLLVRGTSVNSLFMITSITIEL